MSRSTKRKHVHKEILEGYYEPGPTERIAQITASRGNNLHEVTTDAKDRFLVSMPTKFRKNVWVKRGDFVVIENIKEGNKVQAEIVNILYAKQIRHLKQNNLWPSFFTEEGKESTAVCNTRSNNNTDSASSDEEEILRNPNHRSVYYQKEDSSSSDENGSHSDAELAQNNDNLMKSNDNLTTSSDENGSHSDTKLAQNNDNLTKDD